MQMKWIAEFLHHVTFLVTAANVQADIVIAYYCGKKVSLSHYNRVIWIQRTDSSTSQIFFKGKKPVL